ncbi:MAG TPA: cobalt transporter CbiM [Armatimonadota bacterium]
MHIPDGYLSPQTYLPAYGAMVPFWSVASRRLKSALRARQVPMVALGSAFSFVIMMFNIPVWGGSSGHAVGAVLIAILLGPWAAVVAVSMALAVQALLFGDGGVTAYGANCLNMAVVLPFTGWWVYRLVAGGAPVKSRRQWMGAALGGYVGLNAAALTTAVMFGIQPIIAHDAAGRALYAPFGLAQAVPAMALTHLLLFGFIEAAVTGAVVSYLQRSSPGLLPAARQDLGLPEEAPRGALRRLVIGLGVLALLSPLGLYLPARFGGGTAWGEWSQEELTKALGYVPQGISRLGGTWRAPLPDYAPSGGESSPLVWSSLWYLASAAAGLAVLALVALILLRRVSRRAQQ